MSENPFVCLFQNLEKISNSIQTHLSTFVARHGNPSQAGNSALFSVSSSPKPSASNANFQTFGPEAVLKKVQTAAPVTKGELGRATWTFLHTLAAQYPDKPTRQQKKDVKELMAILSRMYPCQECADHFKDILRANPVQAGSHTEFSQWLCHVHNVVNRSLGKSVFPCERVDARWGKLECELRACDLQGTLTKFWD
ncbi:FAD-linked sulfhydryl oxidase ERV1 isoform X2 [Syzygium oleosum]|uniref:FAD-linked sulfhydryl oxidase ERV1 isoform X2 n=1 Tax=Syzygium oleosum TaxID=219896 RepID=UPI0024B8F8D5|nr:FAD-linked sulfhydryl oxidase ERV1 isoform X2 [Syzygium oleosum]